MSASHLEDELGTCRDIYAIWSSLLVVAFAETRLQGLWPTMWIFVYHRVVSNSANEQDVNCVVRPIFPFWMIHDHL